MLKNLTKLLIVNEKFFCEQTGILEGLGLRKTNRILKQKKTWIYYLTIGINSLFFFFSTSCGETTIDYKVYADIIYKNETAHTIGYFQYDTNGFQQLIFELEPSSEKKIEIRESGPNTNITNCCQGIFEDIQGIQGIKISYNNDSKCLIYENGQGPTTSNILNAYESREIEQKFYEFVYTFTEEEYNNATNCVTKVSDLIDDETTDNTNEGYGSIKTGNDEQDQVSGFTIAQLEYSLRNVRSWNDWRDRLIAIKGGYDYNNNRIRLFAAYE